jgi:DNA polymerase elongation subunit (family B)
MALLIVSRTIDRIMTAGIQLQDLVVSKILGQGLGNYKSLFPHVSAAIQLTNPGKSSMVREGVEYIHINAHHTNPLRRVNPTDLIRPGEVMHYDKDK